MGLSEIGVLSSSNLIWVVHGPLDKSGRLDMQVLLPLLAGIAKNLGLVLAWLEGSKLC